MVSGMEPEEMVNLTSNAVQEMINQHQQLPGSVKRVNFKNQFIEESVFFPTRPCMTGSVRRQQWLKT